jgi:hypothetical protein
MKTISADCAADLGRNASQDRLTAYESTKSVNLFLNIIVRLRLCRQVIPLVAGVDRHSDCFLDMGDFMTSNPFKYQDVWLMPHLRLKMSGGHRVATGTLIGNYVRSLIPTAPQSDKEQKIMAPFQLRELPPDANAGSFRPGVCNTLATTNPTEINVHTTGTVTFNQIYWASIHDVHTMYLHNQMCHKTDYVNTHCRPRLAIHDWMCFLCICRPQ